MGEVIQLEMPDRPENVAALIAMRDAVDTAKIIGFDRKTFLSAAANVWDSIEQMEAAGERE